MAEESKYRGYLTKFLWQKPGGWGLALFANEENPRLQIKIKGSIAAMTPRVLYEVSGVLERHPKYGLALEVETYQQAEINSVAATIKYLSSDLFPGIGRKTAELVVNFYQEGTIHKIREHPESLASVTGLEPYQRDLILKGFQRLPQHKLRQIFLENNLRIPILEKILLLTDDYEEIQQLLKNNFHAFAQEQHWGPFLQVDKIALFFGLDPHSPERIGYWAQYRALKLAFNSGNTFSDLKTLQNKLRDDLAIDDSQILKAGLLYAKEHQLLHFNNQKVYAQEAWEDENIIAQALGELMIIPQESALSPVKFKLLLSKIEAELSSLLKTSDFHFDRSQKESLNLFLKESVTLISGGPGTGKSTLICGLVLMYQHLFPQSSIIVATPTGRASARLNALLPTTLKAVTLHRILEATENGVFGRNSATPLEADLIILDEMSMVDNHLFSRLMLAKGSLKKLVLVGDIDQLPSVNYGNLFADLIESQTFAFEQLITTHRQKKGNGIIELATKIKTNQLATIDWMKLSGVETHFNSKYLSKMQLLELDYGSCFQQIINQINTYQIITPFYAGSLGVEALNSFIQNRFNDQGKNSLKINQSEKNTFAVGDKIICLKNNFELGLHNGEVGLIKKFEFTDGKVTHALIDFGDHKKVNFPAENFSDLALGYACTVHKTQGSEYQRVVFILEKNFASQFLNKQLIYTAITRAKESLLIIGDQNIFLEACKRVALRRLTTLKSKIEAEIKCHQKSSFVASLL